MPGPIARLGDITTHGGVIMTGSSNVVSGGMPVATMGGQVMCPVASPTPHGPETLVPMTTTVFVNKKPVATQNTLAVGAGPPSTVALGNMRVLIETGGAGGGSGGGGSSEPVEKAAEALKAGKVSPVEGTESYPVEVQATALVMQEYITPKGQKLDLELIATYAEQYQREQEEKQKYKDLTIADFVDVLKSTESKDGYAGALHFCGYLNYTKLCDKARDFINGKDTDSRNDPNQMPTRFMILYGADDTKLQEINDHPEDPEHKMNIENLRKGLRAMGYTVAEAGSYDIELYQAHMQYIITVMQRGMNIADTHVVKEGEELGAIADRYMLPSWKYLYEVNKDVIGENPDLLKPGTELTIPKWDATSGDEAISEKGGKPKHYVDGAVYRYPWQPLSGSFFQADETEYRKSEEQKQQSGKETSVIEVYSQWLDEIIVEREISRHDELAVLVPDSDDFVVRVDGRKVLRKDTQ